MDMGSDDLPALGARDDVDAPAWLTWRSPELVRSWQTPEALGSVSDVPESLPLRCGCLRLSFADGSAGWIAGLAPQMPHSIASAAAAAAVCGAAGQSAPRSSENPT